MQYHNEFHCHNEINNVGITFRNEGDFCCRILRFFSILFAKASLVDGTLAQTK